MSTKIGFRSEVLREKSYLKNQPQFWSRTEFFHKSIVDIPSCGAPVKIRVHGAHYPYYN